jgi:hypothetical protein
LFAEQPTDLACAKRYTVALDKDEVFMEHTQVVSSDDYGQSFSVFRWNATTVVHQSLEHLLAVF